MNPGLKGTITLQVPGQPEHTFNLEGEAFSWEDGGETDASFLFKDLENDIEVTLSVEDGNAVFGDFWLDDIRLEVVEGDLEANDAIMSYDHEDY
ncbi:hypothetical protein [Billgrantia ethanolica]|uniref:Uncharacterized protein n=1 Tax=Billgrantia ethanolica TaxID=2733486 RepID=A0ABS9A930_9GAMM|nr:hypothetical protein [Halomonas ethanolica]MCE8005285.1 hypothetical protein [Halomonas ethanolica]